MGFSTQASTGYTTNPNAGYSTPQTAANLGTFALGSQITGGVTAAIGAYASAQSRRAQAGIDDTNARLSELGAQAALLQGQRQEQQSQLSTAALKSTQRATFAANGVDLGEGSAARTLTSTDVLGQVDANTIHANAVRAAFGYRTQELNYQNDAMQRRAGPGGAGAAFGTLLGSAGQVASTWYQMAKSGVFDPNPNPNLRAAVTSMGSTPQAGY